MTNQERMTALNQDPRVLAVVTDQTEYLVHLARGWQYQGRSFIHGRKLRVIHGTQIPATMPDPKRPPELRGWTCTARFPASGPGTCGTYNGIITERHPKGRYWKARNLHGGHAHWQSINPPTMRDFHPPSPNSPFPQEEEA